MSVGAVETIKKPEPEAQAPQTKETKDYYAWSHIDFGAEVTPEGYVTKRHVVNYGDKVTQKDLGSDEDEWNKLIEERVIRKSIPPDTKAYESPKRALVAKAKEAMDAALAGGE